MSVLQKRLEEHRAGRGTGIYSVCSSHPVVIEAALREASRRGQTVLIESTSNQVNQDGGYSGMTPARFREYVAGIAAHAGVAGAPVVLGGDHLGPNCWRSDPAEVAMQRSERLIADYVAAGFHKIHLDCSMSCAGDPPVLTDAIVAERAARLARVAEATARSSGVEAPVYVIGTEVPVPGGAAEALETLAVTTPDAVTVTLEAHRAAFRSAGLNAAWERVIALVVQPGVEFDHHKVIDYVPARARALAKRIESEPGLVYEAHSTDYQTAAALAALVRDHFAILKVGPGVTFALREMLWALVAIEAEVGGGPEDSLKDVVLAAMKSDPRYWSPYYADPKTRAVDLEYSLSDRIRYYWNVPAVQKASEALIDHLHRRRIPLTLLSQYLPAQYAAVRAGSLANDPRALLLHGVGRVLESYANACEGPGRLS
jgi:D-tagatose-1,6-bisphosphate aldolase subunit GatZ/KbaZ